MAYFLATNVLSDTPPEKIPCICSNRNQYIKFDNIDATQPYSVDTKIRLFGNNPGTTGDDYLGNFADTAYGYSWRLYNNGGSYSSTNPGWSRFQDAHARIDWNPAADRWFDLKQGPSIFMMSDGYSWQGNSYSFPSPLYTNADYPLCLFGLPDRPNNRSACAFARTKIILDEVAVADLVPINIINNRAHTFVDEGEYLGYSYIDYDRRIDTANELRDYLRVEAYYVDENNVKHYATPYIIALSDFTGDVRPYLTFDDGQQKQIVITSNRLYYQDAYLPTGATKVVMSLYNAGLTKEGGFYDIINDKYYFSNTSTPLVYSEL